MKKEKTKVEQPSFFKELGCFMKPYGFKYGISIFVSILAVAFLIAGYAFVGVIAGILFTEDPEWEEVFIYLFFAICSKILYALCINLSTWISHKAAYGTLKDIRLNLANKMLKLPMGYFEENGSGRLKTLMVDHVENMEKTLAHMLPELTANLLVPLALFIWMFFIDWRLALIVLGWIILGFSISFGMMKNYDQKYQGQIKAFKGMNQAIIEYVNGIKVIKTFGRFNDYGGKYNDSITNHANYNINWVKETELYTSLAMAIAPFSVLPVAIFGLMFFNGGSIEPGNLILMIILNISVFMPLMNASTYFDQLAGMSVNAKEIKDVLDYKELVRGMETETDNYNIKFDNVSFSYNEQKNAINNINLEIKEGSMVALVGKSGSGKSTIAKLLAGYWDINEGSITIGGKNINSFTQNTINKMISFVDQDTYLFDKSVLANIKLSKPNASKEEVTNICKKIGLHEFIMGLPNGYETVVGNFGNKLSGGEKQRIAIARAILKDSPIIILDEATASTDPENEYAIQTAIKALAKDKTLIVVAHRLYTIVDADMIVLIDNGNIKDKGTHEELLEKSNEYKMMWELNQGEKDA